MLPRGIPVLPGWVWYWVGAYDVELRAAFDRLPTGARLTRTAESTQYCVNRAARRANSLLAHKTRAMGGKLRERGVETC